MTDTGHLHGSSFCAQCGLTLIELVVFMVVISIGLAGILGALNLTTRNSANPMLLKQQVAIAESLLEEIESKPFTWCDPDDANVTTATSSAIGAAGCATTAQGLAKTSGEDRYSQTLPFDNVGDYAGFNMNAGILNPASGVVIGGLGSYTASVVITPVGNIAPTNVGAADAVLRVEVSVGLSGQPGSTITLTGYRYRYAPNVP